jgi:hypothetical protein
MNPTPYTIFSSMNTNLPPPLPILSHPLDIYLDTHILPLLKPGLFIASCTSTIASPELCIYTITFL